MSNMPSVLLVVAQSARMIVQMAVNAGLAPIAIDCFGDVDTRQNAMDFMKVESLGKDDLGPAVEAMSEAHGVTHVLYGSGFEAHAESLAFLEQGWTVLGNPPKIFWAFQDKREFFSSLDDLSIEYPETRFSPPIDDDYWLLKPMRGEGGVGIRRYDGNSLVSPDGYYWQSFVDGEIFSLTFIARDGQAEILGFNRQWCQALNDDQSFVFSGIASHAQMSDCHKAMIGEWMAKLVSVYPLRGLGSLDFIVAEEGCYVLEINARIPASAQLYGDDVLLRHIRACLGDADNRAVEPCRSLLPGAYRVLYAAQNVVIPESMEWPEWAADRPCSGSIIGKGRPICSIIAGGKTSAQVAKQLKQRRQIIENRLNIGS